MKPKDREETAFYVALGRMLPDKSAEKVAEIGWNLLRCNRLWLNAASTYRTSARDRLSAELSELVHDAGLLLRFRPHETHPFIGRAVLCGVDTSLPIPWT